MKSRWLVNLVLLALVAGIVAFLYLRPEPKSQAQQSHEISALKLSDFSRLRVEFPAKAPVVFEKVDGYWRLVQPYKTRADQLSVQRILSIVAARSSEKFAATDLARFGLDNPSVKVKMDNEEFLFGTFNPVTGEQYVAYKDSVYLVPTTYAEAASVQATELIDKNPLKPTEKIAGFDFSRLEQWEEARLNLDLVDGKWKVSVPNAKPVQNEINEWLDTNWKQPTATSVEPYTPDRKTVYPSFEIKLQGGGKVHFDKLQESPELLLGRPDEGLIYHLPQDAGFSMLNPPIGVSK
ncbi:MAG TPA: DUF4340 domain-containing protein [Methylophilaceae bacterium]|nr:DUF4340 domain-containing protein [Methylophilaceae bacterium]